MVVPRVAAVAHGVTLVVALVAAGCGGTSGPRSGLGPQATTTAVPGSPASSAPVPVTGAAPPATVAPPTATTIPPVTLAGGGAPRLLVSPHGVVVPVVSGTGATWTVRTPCGATATSPGTPLAHTTVVLDPGHGGDEVGAIGPNGLTEKALNLAVATQAQAALAAAGVTGVLTRTADYRMTLDARAAVVTADQPQAMVSIHHNANPDGPHDGPGTETYYQLRSPTSKRLAGLIWEEVTRALAPYHLAWEGDTDAGAKYRLTTSGGDYYAVLRAHPATASVLAELAFVTDPAEATVLARPDVQKAEGQAVARGIVRWLTTKDPGSGFVTPYPRTEPAGPGGGAGGCTDPPL